MKTLLIADDDPILLKALELEMQQRGFLVFVAQNGQEAFQSAKKYKPDLILMDVAMPVASGIKALDLLRNSTETQRIPVIFLTSLPSTEIYPTVEKGARVAYLKKPVDIDDLLSLIKQFLPK